MGLYHQGYMSIPLITYLDNDSYSPDIHKKNQLFKTLIYRTYNVYLDVFWWRGRKNIDKTHLTASTPIYNWEFNQLNCC